MMTINCSQIIIIAIIVFSPYIYICIYVFHEKYFKKYLKTFCFIN